MNPAVPAPGPPSPTSVTAGGRDPLPTPPALGSGVRTAAARKWMGRRGGPAAQLGAREKFPGASEGVGGDASGFFPAPPAPGRARPRPEGGGGPGPESARACPSVDVGVYTCVPSGSTLISPVPLHLRLRSPRASTLCRWHWHVYTPVPSLQRPAPAMGASPCPFPPAANLWLYACDSLGLSPRPAPHLSIGQDTSSRRVPPFPSPTTSTPTWQRGN